MKWNFNIPFHFKRAAERIFYKEASGNLSQTDDIFNCTVHIIHEEKNKNIKLSVALPCYNAIDIGWLCMEGLCNQVDIDFDWEIIICEEHHDKELGKDFFNQYISRLSDNRCKKISYIELNKKVNLSEKWKIMGQNLDNYAGGFVLQAADCYAPSKRLSISENLINEKDYDWIDFSKGYFYSFPDDKLILYDSQENRKALTHLHMTFKAKYAKYLKSSTRSRGVDGFLFKTIKKINPKFKIFVDKQLLMDGIDTDGYNNISKERIDYYNNVKWPFIASDKKLEDTEIPQYVVEKIKLLYCAAKS